MQPSLFWGIFKTLVTLTECRYLVFTTSIQSTMKLSTQVLAKNKAQSKQIHEKKILADSKLANLILVSKLLS